MEATLEFYTFAWRAVADLVLNMTYSTYIIPIIMYGIFFTRLWEELSWFVFRLHNGIKEYSA